MNHIKFIFVNLIHITTKEQKDDLSLENLKPGLPPPISLFQLLI